MYQSSQEITVNTRGRGLIEITPEIAKFVSGQGMTEGLLTLFIRHTSASLTIQENADPDVLHDLTGFFQRLVPDGDSSYLHRSEGPDDMPAHIRSALTQSNLSIPVTLGNISLGTWQDIYLFEHRKEPHTRLISLHIIGE